MKKIKVINGKCAKKLMIVVSENRPVFKLKLAMLYTKCFYNGKYSISKSTKYFLTTHCQAACRSLLQFRNTRLVT